MPPMFLKCEKLAPFFKVSIEVAYHYLKNRTALRGTHDGALTLLTASCHEIIDLRIVGT